MTIQFGSRLRIPLEPKHMEIFSKQVTANGNAGIAQDITGQSYLAVNTNHALGHTLDDQADVFKAIEEMVDLSPLREEEMKLRELKSQLKKLESVKEEVQRHSILSIGEIFSIYGITLKHTSMPKNNAKMPDKLNAIQIEYDSIEAEFAKLQVRFTKETLPKLKPRKDAYETLKEWVKQQFREYEGLYRDQSGLFL